MKRILLASTAMVAFAGAAAAEVTFGGDAELGYNDDFNNGMFYSFGLSVAGSMELNNGVTAAISGDIEFNNSGVDGTYDGNEITIDDLVMSLSNDMASLTFGDTAPSADKHWSGVGNMDADGFNDEDDLADERGILRGEITFGGTTASLSYAVVDANGGTDDDLTAMQLAIVGSAGNFNYKLAYQDDSNANGKEIFGIRAGTSFGGADVAIGYADDGTETSTGLSVSYPVGPVTVGVFYVMQDVADDNWGISVDYANGPLTVGALYHDGNDEDLQLNVGYDVGNGLTLFGGYRDEGSAANDTYFYLGGDYDLGGGANLRVSYADADSGVGTALDELGKSEDVKDGFTIAVGMSF